VNETDAQRLALAQATARRWFRVLESMAGSDTSDEVFAIVHRQWRAAERAVVLLQEEGRLPHPMSRRS
jgi:hypothetical protein